MPRNLANSAFMKPFVVLALPGMYLFYKYNQYKQQQQEQSKRKVTEKELAHLNHKIDSEIVVITHGWDEWVNKTPDEYMDRHAERLYDYSKQISSLCPDAVVCLATPPIDSLLPFYTEAVKTHGNYNPNKILGICSLMEMRANAITADYLYLNPVSVHVPVIGGIGRHTSVPVFSNAEPFSDFNQDQIHRLSCQLLSTHEQCKKMKTSAPLSAGYATARFVLTVAKGIFGDEDAVATAYLRSDALPQVKYFATKCKFGQDGVCFNYGVPKLNSYEVMMLENAAKSLECEIKSGECLFGEIRKKCRDNDDISCQSCSQS